jgi:ankyrin repeat protein
MQEDPGRQSMSGSFNPIDVGEWSGQVYIGETEKFFTAISCGDRDAVARFLREGADVHCRDHVGRTCLHLAIISNAVDVACDLIDTGARLTARLVNGRNSLHLAVQMDQLVVVRKILERSAINAERSTTDTTMDVDPKEFANESDRESSRDDWSSDGAENDVVDKGSEKENKKDTEDTQKPTNTNEIPEDQLDQPDVLDVNLADWDSRLTPLMYGVLYASSTVVEELLSAGADPQFVTQSNHRSPSSSCFDPEYAHFYPLALAIVAGEDDRIEKIVQRLLVAGASPSVVDDKTTFTIFHRAVAQKNATVVSTLLRYSANASISLNFPSVSWSEVTFPVVTAISNGDYSILALLLAHGVKLQFTEEDVSRAYDAWQVYSSLSHG